MFDAKKIREISNEAQAEILRKQKEAEELARKERERLAKEEAERERLRQEELRAAQEREAFRRRILKESQTLLTVLKRETTLKALKGATELKFNLDAEVDQDYVSLELAKKYFKTDWDARERDSEIQSVIRLIGLIRDLEFDVGSKTGIPEVDNIVAEMNKIFDYLIDDALADDDGLINKEDFSLAELRWADLTRNWQDAFEVAEMHFNYVAIYDSIEGPEGQLFRLVELLKRFYMKVNQLFSFDEDSPTIIHVRWANLDWLSGDCSGEWSGHRLAWLSSYVGQYFLGQLEQYLRELALSAKNSASIFIEPLSGNPDRWGQNTVFRAKVDGKPIGAVILSIEFMAYVLRLMQFEVELWETKEGHRLDLAW